MALPGASVVSAAEWRAGGEGRDYARVNRLRDDIARDRARLNEDIRCGRSAAAAEDARDLARDQRALNGRYRDIQRDRVDTYRDRQDLRRDYRYGWR
jgi:hypothetical protein